MPTAHLVAVGGSAGAIDALLELVPHLPPRFAAPVVVAVHRRAHESFHLDQVLRRESLLSVRAPNDGDPLEPGTIFVAPPNRHLTVDQNRLRVRFGPTENGQRPSIDMLLRSAAVAFGANCTGVLLSGMSVDGVAGLDDVRRRAGTTVVQDPDDALFPALPEAARRSVAIDHVLPVSEMPALFEKVVGVERRTVLEPVSPGSIEAAAYDRDPDTGRLAGGPSPFACPDCGGVLWQVDHDDGLIRFRCRVGHAWTANALLDAQDRQSEAALWAALRSLEEQVHLSSRMAALSATHGQTRFTDRYNRRAARLQAHVDRLRTLLESTSPAPPDDGSETAD